MKISYYKNYVSKKPEDVELIDIFNKIKNGDYKEVQKVRQLKADGGDWTKEKSKLPAITPSCRMQWGSRMAKNIAEYSGIVCIDIDNIAKDLDIVRSIAGGLQYTYMMFKSPSADGLKILVKTNATIQTHETAFLQLCDYFGKELDVKSDRTTKDIARLCYVSADEDAYLNENAAVFEVKIETGIASSQKPPRNDGKEINERFRECLTATNNSGRAFIDGEKNNYVYFLANRCNEKGLEQETALQLILKNHGYDKSEVTATVKSAYKHTEDHGKFATVPLQSLSSSSDKIIYTDIELINRNTDDTWLVEGLLRRSSLSVLGGVQDTGKSLLLRQLCIQNCLGIENFLGYKIKPHHQHALYVSTEDNEDDISEGLKKQFSGLSAEPSGRLKVIIANALSLPEILLEIESHLTLHKMDLVIVDAFGDIHENADMNNATGVRKTLAPFQYISKRHSTHVAFIHHLTKASMSASPSHKNLSGSGAISQKVRLALQLTRGEQDHYLSITKGNSFGQSKKQSSQVLNFSEQTLLFSDSGNIIQTDFINSNRKEEKEGRLQKLADEIFDGKEMSFTEFTQRHQQQNGTSVSQAERDHRNMKEAGIIIKEGKKWKVSDYSDTIPSET